MVRRLKVSLRDISVEKFDQIKKCRLELYVLSDIFYIFIIFLAFFVVISSGVSK